MRYEKEGMIVFLLNDITIKIKSYLLIFKLILELKLNSVQIVQILNSYIENYEKKFYKKCSNRNNFDGFFIKFF